MSGNLEMVAWIILVGGSVLALLGLFKIILSGARLLAWLMLLGVGLAGMGFGIRHHPSVLETIGLPTEMAKSVRSFLVAN